VIGHKAYCGTGYLPWFVPSADFYSFDLNSGLWDTVSSLPAGKERQSASGFASGSYGFIEGGVNGGSCLNDVWKYDPLSNTWVGKNALPDSGRGGAACFVINNFAYIVGGRTVSNRILKEVWAYDIQNDS